MSIIVSNLSKFYGVQKAVNSISFSVSKGEILGFLGPNGAGKSTTMKMITGYLQPDAGTIKVCDDNVTQHNIETKRKIGYLPESNPLYTDMYVKEYLLFIASVHQIKNSKKRIEEVITIVGLDPECHKKIGQLSKGYKQRVGLAAALVHDPEVLILDEPTSGLDPNQIVEIREVIRNLSRQKTILFSSHIMQEVEALCERVIIINKGNIVADDLLSNLKKGNSKLHNIVVEFKEKILVEFIKDMESKEDIITVINERSFMIETKDAEKAKRKILELSLRYNLNISSLQSESRQLETVFRHLTS